MLLCALCEGVEVVVRAGSEICDGASCGRRSGGTQAVTSGAAARWFEDYYVVGVSAGGVFLKLSRCFVRLLEVVRTGAFGEELRLRGATRCRRSVRQRRRDTGAC